MLGNLVEGMLSNWSIARDIVLAMKAKMVEMDTQVTTLDNTFAWNCMADNAGYVRIGDGGSGSATEGKLRDTSTTPAPQAPPFPIPSIVEPLFKRMKDVDG